MLGQKQNKNNKYVDYRNNAKRKRKTFGDNL